MLKPRKITMWNMSSAYRDFKELLEMTEDDRNSNLIIAELKLRIDTRQKELTKGRGEKERTEYQTLNWILKTIRELDGK